MPLRRRTLLAIALTPLAARAAPPRTIVASFSILADLATQLAAGRATVTAIVGPDQDPHGFEPRPSQAAAIEAADLFLINGLGLEPWARGIARKPAIIASTTVRARRLDGAPDPHAWQNVENAMIYAANITTALLAADPAGTDAYRAAAAAYRTRLATLHDATKSTLAAIPRARRRVVTTHDAMFYFGAAYGIDFLAPQGLATGSEPTPRAFAALARQIKRDHITALFLDGAARSPLLETLARESGARIGGRLFADSLSPPDGPASTYVDMIEHNRRTIVEALA